MPIAAWKAFIGWMACVFDHADETAFLAAHQLRVSVGTVAEGLCGLEDSLSGFGAHLLVRLGIVAEGIGHRSL
jgi:hypothetical protein